MPVKKVETPQLNRVIKKTETPQKLAETPQKKKRGNTSTINIGKQLKNIRKSLTLVQF